MKKIFLAALTVIIFSSPVFAQIKLPDINIEKVQQKAREAGNKEFKTMDKDGDGKISKGEYLDYVMEETRKKNEAAFNQIDQNNDGFVSKSEYEDFMNFATSKMNDFFKMLK